MKTTLDLRGRPVDLQGEFVGPEENTLGKIAATAVTNGTEGPAVKLFSISQDLWQRGTTELDLEDLRMLRKQLDTNRNLMVIAKAQILMKIDVAIDKATKKAEENGGKTG